MNSATARGWSLPVVEVSQVGDARRRVAGLAADLGMPESAAARLAILATEAAGNLVKHADGGGELLVQVVANGAARGIELLALDRAPGMRDVGNSMRDGVSTAGSPGTGLGAMSRLADDFAIDSAPERGTVVLMRVWSAAPPAGAASALQVGALNIPYPGEEVCGDGWAMRRQGAVTLFLVADGLGHGAGAADAAGAAVRAFREAPFQPPAEMLQTVHAALRRTRGAAAALVALDTDAACVRFAGVGNISGVVHTPGHGQRMVSHHGVVGDQMRRVQEFTYPCPAGALLVLHSDGVTERWDLDRYAAARGRDPALLAALLYRDFARRTDDATVVVARAAAPA